jgi:hypothetical protein
MAETKWEKGPWSVELRRDSGGIVRGVRVLSATPRHVYSMTIQTETVTDRVGRRLVKPGTEPKVKTTHDIQPATVCTCGMAEEPIEICDCGVTYVGLPPETLLANGDLIAAAPELYEALSAFIDGTGEPWERVVNAKRALDKAKGETPNG